MRCTTAPLVHFLLLSLLPGLRALALLQPPGVAAAVRSCVRRAPPLISLSSADPLVNLKSAVAGTYFRLTDFRYARLPRCHPHVFFTSARTSLTAACSLGAPHRVARASHILLKGYDEGTVSQLETWKAEIANDPDKFAEIASANSLCPSRRKGGDLGFFTRGKMVNEIDTVVFNEDPGAVYGPVRSDFGHHLIFLHSCRQP